MKIPPKSVLTSLFVSAFLCFVIYRFLLIFNYSADIGGSENSIVYFVQRILAGFSPYTDPHLPPYSIAQYPPFYYYLDVLFAKLAGIGPDDVRSLFIVNRIVGLVCNGLYLLSVFYVSKKIFEISTARALAICLFCFIFLESPSFARPDSLSLALYLWSLFYFFKSMKKQGPSSAFLLVTSALFCGFSFLAKQTSVTLPLLIALWLLLQKKSKYLLIFSLVYVAAIAIFLAVLFLQFGMKPIYQNLILGVDNGIGLTWFWDFIVSYLFGSFGSVWILVSIILLVRLKKNKGDLFGFCRMLLSGLLVFSLIFSLKWGSWISYFTEWWTVVFILTGYFWDEFRSILQQFSVRFPYFLIGFVLIIKIVSIVYPLYGEIKNAIGGNKTAYLIDKATADWIGQNSGPTSSFVFNNSDNIHRYLNNFLFRRSVVPQYEIVTYTLYSRNIFDYSDLRKAFSEGRIEYIIADAHNSQLKYMDNEIKNYKPIYRNEVYLIYRLEEPK